MTLVPLSHTTIPSNSVCTQLTDFNIHISTHTLPTNPILISFDTILISLLGDDTNLAQTDTKICQATRTNLSQADTKIFSPAIDNHEHLAHKIVHKFKHLKIKIAKIKTLRIYIAK